MSAVQSPFPDYSPPEITQWDPARWTAALGAVLISALAAGSFRGWLARRGKGAELISFPIAWIMAIAAAPVLPAFFGQKIGFGTFRIDSCWVPVNTGDATSAVTGVIFFPIGAMVESGPFSILSAGFLVWIFVIHRFGPALPAKSSPWRHPSMPGQAYPPYIPPRALPALHTRPGLPSCATTSSAATSPAAAK
ncbi:MAG TPA: hypothetical protein VF375_10135 [Candidatus Limnocylindrales bacterium]